MAPSVNRIAVRTTGTARMRDPLRVGFPVVRWCARRISCPGRTVSAACSVGGRIVRSTYRRPAPSRVLLMTPERYKVRVTKDHLVFCCGHFISYEGSLCERLHGHNYRAAVEVEG